MAPEPAGGSGGLKGSPPVEPAREPATRALLDRIRADAPVTRRDYLRILVTVSGGCWPAPSGSRSGCSAATAAAAAASR
jgi:hypothetical protein